jgi:hypothetical protein
VQCRPWPLAKANGFVLVRDVRKCLELYLALQIPSLHPQIPLLLELHAEGFAFKCSTAMQMPQTPAASRRELHHARE